MKKTIQLQGLDCANCAAELERKIAKLEGVRSANLTFVTQKLIVEYDSDDVLQEILHTANTFEEISVADAENEHAHHTHTECTCGHCHSHEHHEHNHEHHNHEHKSHVHTSQTKKEGHKQEWLTIALSALLFGIGIVMENLGWQMVGKIIAYVCFAIAYLVVGYPVLKSTWKNIKKGRIFDENFLMTVASIGAVCIGETEEAVLVMLLYQIGELLQAIAVGSSRKSIADLMELKSEWATVVVNGEYKQIAPEEIRVGDILVVKAGERAAVDGILLSEEGLLDTKSLTGESEYRAVKCGEEILSGCINVGGMYEMKAVRAYKDSAVSRILNLVENASSVKAEPEKFITKFAKYYTPIVCGLACIVAFLFPLLDGLLFGNGVIYKDFARWVQSALTFLVISCPCALIISVPLTYFSGLGACAKSGILVKGATHFDVAASASMVAFDKTGTLTLGDFTVCEVYPAAGYTDKEILEIAAAIEKGSAHPIAKAFENLETEYKAENIREVAGKGLIATINGERYLLGIEKLLRENGVSVTVRDGAYTLIYLAKEREFLGGFAIGDKIKPETKDTISILRNMGIDRLIMLTGDREERAYKIANAAGMYEVNAGLLPDQKLAKVKELRREGTVIYVGDGINDAPVMTVADCAVSMGTLGSDAAVEASDMVLVSDCLTGLPKAIRIARYTKRIVLQNIVGSIALKILFMVLGLCGVLPLWLAVFADVGVMLLAVLNSFRVRWIKY